MNDNPLLDYFNHNDGRLIHKWVHYFEIYHRHFAAYRDLKPTILEFGVNHGGSLQMWQHYFGAGARICGVDIDPRCKIVEEEGIEVFIGDQQDKVFLHELAAALGPIDILIDDGGHTMTQQITTFTELYPVVKIPGLYLVEDMHTSYWKKFGGGVGKRNSFVEYSKRLIDRLNAWHVSPKMTGWYGASRLAVDDFTRSAYSMTYYDSMLVIEKRKMVEPIVRKSGSESF